MNVRRLVFLAGLLGAPLAAQQVQQLPRVSPTTGLADSSLFLCVDSTKTLTRACKFSDVQKRLAYKSFDSLVAAGARIPGTLNLTGGSITGSPTATFGAITTSGCTGCAPAVADSATGAARAQVLTTARTIGGTSFNGSANIVPGLSDSATGAARAQILTTARTIGGVSFNGSANIIPDTATGVVRAQTLTTSRALWGQSFNGSAAITGSLTGVGDISGGASSMNLLAGTGASRTLTLQTTTSGSTAKNTLVLGADTTASFLGNIRASNGTALLPAVSFTNSTNLGMYRVGTDTVGFAVGGVQAIFIPSIGKVVGNADLNLAAKQNGGTVTLSAKSAAGSESPVLRIRNAGVQQAAAGANGAANAPFWTFTGDTTTGVWYRGNAAGSDTLKISTSGVESLGIRGGATPTIYGGAGNLTIQAGTGNSRTMTLQTTTSAGAVKNTLVLGSDSSSTFLGNATFNSSTDATSITSLGVVAPFSTAAFPSFRFNGDADNGMYHFGTDTIGFATGGVASLAIRGGASPTIFGGAGNMIIQAGTGASRSLTFKATNAISAAFTEMVLSAAGQTQVARNTNAVTPDYTFVGDTASGFYQPATNQAGIATAGAASLIISGGATPTLTGGAGSMVFLAGTGASRTLTLQSSNSSSAATTFAIGSGDTLKLSGHLIATGLTAEGSTQSALCITNGGGQVFINAAATCTVSASRFKTGIAPLSFDLAHRIVMQTRPVTFSYKSGGGKAIGVIAEQVDSIDSRLATRDAKGQINSVNYEQFTMALLVEVQQLRRQVDSLIAAGKKKP